MKIEKKIIEKISSHIETENSIEKYNKTNGSLYSLFENQYFDMNFVIFYLEKYNESGIIDNLVNIMYERFINESFFYLPQLWYIYFHDKI